MTTQINKIDLNNFPKFIVFEGDDAYRTDISYFNPNVETVKELINPDESITEAIVDLEELKPYPFTWEDITLTADLINQRIDNGHPFDHYDPHIPNFFIRIAAGMSVFNERYPIAIANSADTTVLVALGLLILDEKHKRIQAETNGYSVVAVVNDKEKDISFAYTNWGDEYIKEDTYAYIAVGPISAIGLHSIINSVLTSPNLKEYHLGEVFESDALRVRGTHEPLRFRLNSVSNEEVVKRYGVNGKRLIQITAADSNNRLPGEEGYDENYDQDVKHTI